MPIVLFVESFWDLDPTLAPWSIKFLVIVVLWHPTSSYKLQSRYVGAALETWSFLTTYRTTKHALNWSSSKISNVFFKHVSNFSNVLSMMLRHFQKNWFQFFFSFFVVLHRFAQTQKNCRGREGCLRGVMVQRAVACSSWKDGQANQGIKVSLKNHTSLKKEPKNEEETKWSKKIKLSISSSATFSSHRTFLHFFCLQSRCPWLSGKVSSPVLGIPGFESLGLQSFFFSLGCGTVKL